MPKVAIILLRPSASATSLTSGRGSAKATVKLGYGGQVAGHSLMML
ncbi:MAG: hypothetical protein PHO20_04900 [Candidatus Peribacteraceae bacterium]|nr:hypothetical protein [Candidatus Peribacteraceae bacterium]MDD5740074.1 hypothetical protein [Candidatus Peribacteraceae bacterium]